MNTQARGAGASGNGETDFAALGAAGMIFSHWAARRPGDIALYSDAGMRTFAQAEENANRLANALRGAGLEPGSPVALICRNRPEFVETWLACLRSGFRLTPINWHLSPSEAAYIIDDCEAQACIVEEDCVAAVSEAEGAALKCVLRVGVDGEGSYASALAEASDAPPADPVLGRTMLYTSGTTGKPKGVIKDVPFVPMPMQNGSLLAYEEGDVNILCGPAYHGGPLTFDIIFPLVSGAAVSMMEKFDAEEVLRRIERDKVTHCHMVSTMFQRLLALPEETRAKYDLSSLKRVIHGAAPTSPEVKRRMIDWFGPIIMEYYAATEASANISITSEDWLKKPGSVGRVNPEVGLRILDDDGNDVPQGEAGRIHFRNIPGAGTRYHNAPEKNAETFAGTHFTVGDIGYLDEDNYLFLTGRSAETIISGGVNIYPQEIDDVLLAMPMVRQSCTIGAPNAEWGEEVRGVVSLMPGVEPSDDLAQELIAHLHTKVARYKVPRQIDFVSEIPHSEAGKVLRRQVREPYWEGRANQIMG